MLQHSWARFLKQNSQLNFHTLKLYSVQGWALRVSNSKHSLERGRAVARKRLGKWLHLDFLAKLNASPPMGALPGSLDAPAALGANVSRRSIVT